MATIKTYIINTALSTIVQYDGTNASQVQALIASLPVDTASYEAYQLTADPQDFLTELPENADPADYTKYLYFPNYNVPIPIGGFVGKDNGSLFLEYDEASLLANRSVYPPTV